MVVSAGISDPEDSLSEALVSSVASPEVSLVACFEETLKAAPLSSLALTAA